MTKSVAIEWGKDKTEGLIEVTHGKLQSMRIVKGKGKCANGRFSVSSNQSCRLEITLDDINVAQGANTTRITVKQAGAGFTFFLRDVTSDNPVLVELYRVVVLPASDKRSYAKCSDAIHSRGLSNIQQEIEQSPEESYEQACAGNRVEPCPTWLGLSRDMRSFEVHYQSTFGYWGYVQPRYHSTLVTIPETEDKQYNLGFAIGSGAACRHEITRRLEDGILPILHSTQREADISYEVTAFATLETKPLNLKQLRGSDWNASYAVCDGNMLSKEQHEQMKDLMDAEMHGREEETVCWLRIQAVNTGKVPRYAWFKSVTMNPTAGGGQFKNACFASGLSRFKDGRVFAINLLDGKAAPQEEMAVMVQPGKSVTLDILIPHQPVDEKRAAKLARQDFDAHISACRKFWKDKLAAGASISVPETAVDERIKAGLLHCDIVTLGKEPAGPALATIGCYAPIGSESSPIIQFFDSMGWHKLAQRSLDFFLARQREDGFIQNFGGYQLETGPALWSMGEHFRYTHDTAWVKSHQAKMIKACDFLLAWRERNKKPEFKGRGYGLLDGKVADPEDFYHSFMLNALSFVGIQRVAEMLKGINHAQSKRLAGEAIAFRKDIRTAYSESVERSPVIPLGDGTWIPTVPPWAEYAGPVALYANGGNWFSHCTFACRDSLIGSLYLVIGEVLDANEIGAEILLKSHQQLFTIRNAGLSQPYYVRHDYIHLLRGEVKEFLKIYYNQFTALQDRETYTFWEHYTHGSPHKTHEEGWFLMQTRWMLWLETGSTLKLLAGIPRRWMEDGKRIELKNVASHFGSLSLRVESRVQNNSITASISCPAKHKPETVVIRLPHPDGRKPISVKGGKYDSATESVTIASFRGKAEVVLSF